MINTVPACGVSFKGTEIKDDKKQVTAKDISQKADEFAKSVNAASEGVKDVTESVTGAVATVAGSVGMIGTAVDKAIPKTVRDKIGESWKNTKESINKAIENLRKNKPTAEGGAQVAKKIPWKQIGIAGGLVAATTAVVLGITHLVNKHKAKQAEATKQVQNEDNFVKNEKPKAEEIED